MRSSRIATSGLLAGLAAALFGASPAVPSARGGPVSLPLEDAPPALEALGDLVGAGAVALSRDGGRAAAAFPHPDKPKLSVVKVSAEGAEPPREFPIRGRVASLRFDRPGETLYAVVVVEDRKGRIADANLHVIESRTLDSRRAVTLPASAGGLDVWLSGSSLVVACRDQLRTVVLPDLRSGPLFILPGDNLAVASLPGGDRVLVGRTEEIVLLDLSDPHGDDGAMPVRDRLPVQAPAIGLVGAPDGARALVSLADGRLLRLRVDPLRVAEETTGTAVAWIGAPVAPPILREAPTPAPAPPEPASAAVVEPEAPVPVDEPREAPTPAPVPPEPAPAAVVEPEAPVPAEEPRDAPRPAPAPPEPAPPVVVEPVVPVPVDEPREAPTPAPVRPDFPPPAAAAPEPPLPVDEPREAPTPAPAPPEPAPPAAAAPEVPVPVDEAREAPPPDVVTAPGSAEGAPPGHLSGSVTGPAADQVVAVVLLGPDSVVTEARRVSPSGDRRWSVGPLEPGRYRVLLDGGGRRVLVCDPPYVTVEVSPDVRVPSIEIRALRAL